MNAGEKSVEQERNEEEQIFFYRIRFREKGQEFTASSDQPRNQVQVSE